MLYRLRGFSGLGLGWTCSDISWSPARRGAGCQAAQPPNPDLAPLPWTTALTSTDHLPGDLPPPGVAERPSWETNSEFLLWHPFPFSCSTRGSSRNPPLVHEDKQIAKIRSLHRESAGGPWLPCKAWVLLTGGKESNPPASSHVCACLRLTCEQDALPFATSSFFVTLKWFPNENQHSCCRRLSRGN